MISLSSRTFYVGLTSGILMILLCSQMQIGAWNYSIVTEKITEIEGLNPEREIANNEGKRKDPKPSIPSPVNKVPAISNRLKKNLTCDYPPLTNVQQFFDYENKEKHCRNLTAFGGSPKQTEKKYYDGRKWVCLDDEYNFKQGKCTVLSFGISNDWSFDDAMGNYGCKVYSFDPTIGLKDFNRSKNIQFFNLGLSDSRGSPFGPGKGEVNRLQTILEKLTLTNHEIDYLKIDIEGNEINFFNDIFTTSPHLLDKIKQIGMEIHPGKVTFERLALSNIGRMQKLWSGMNKLECAGFKLLSFEQNQGGRNLYNWKNQVQSACSEVVWGKVNS